MTFNVWEYDVMYISGLGIFGNTDVIIRAICLYTRPLHCFIASITIYLCMIYSIHLVLLHRIDLTHVIVLGWLDFELVPAYSRFVHIVVLTYIHTYSDTSILVTVDIHVNLFQHMEQRSALNRGLSIVWKDSSDGHLHDVQLKNCDIERQSRNMHNHGGYMFNIDHGLGNNSSICLQSTFTKSVSHFSCCVPYDLPLGSTWFNKQKTTHQYLFEYRQYYETGRLEKYIL